MKADLLRAAPSEKQFAAMFERYAKLRGWVYFHAWNSRHSVAGFPDYVLVRGRAVLFVELKTDKGKVSPAQEGWIERLRAADQEAVVWRPSQWAEIERVLT